MYLKQFLKLVEYFGEARRLKLVIFFLMALISGVLEFIGVFLIYPFVLAIINPEIIVDKIDILPDRIEPFFASIPAEKLALLIGLIAMLVFVLKNVYMMCFVYIQSRFLIHWKQAINNKIMEYFLFAPYKDVQKISVSDRMYVISTLTEYVTSGFCMRYITLVTNACIVLFILSLIIYKYYVVGILAIIFVLVSLFVQNNVFRKKMSEVNSTLASTAKEFNAITFMNVNCLKELRVQSSEDDFYTRYKVVGNRYIKKQSWLTFLSGISPYVVEILIVVMLILVGFLISVAAKQNSSLFIASLALIVASIFRIAPALNRIQTSLMNLPSTVSFLNALISFYDEYGIARHLSHVESNKNIKLKDSIELRDVCFSYEEDQPVLKNVNMDVKKGEFVGIIGLSGSGKTTLADVITGLLPVDSGEVKIDGVKIEGPDFSALRKSIGYVQQEINVLNASFRENVAWSVDIENIDDEKVKKLLKQVKLWDVVERYEDGIYANPFEGENGLSKGQKQRIAIARALYRNPSILIFDEATSALDVKTEHEITEILTQIDPETTIIAIAHRLSTLQACDKLIYIKDGEVVAIGKFADLTTKYPDFMELVRLSSIDIPEKE